MKGRRDLHTFPGVRGVYVPVGRVVKLKAEILKMQAQSNAWKKRYLGLRGQIRAAVRASHKEASL